MPLIDSPGTKLKVIENLLIGVVTIGTKHAFKGIELWKKILLLYIKLSEK